MVRMTNNSLQNLPNIDLSSNTSIPSPVKPQRKPANRSSNLSGPVLRPSPIEEGLEGEPPKRALGFEPPTWPAGDRQSGIEWLKRLPQYSSIRSQPQQLSNQGLLRNGSGLLPSPTFSDSAENVRPGLYTDHTGHTFPIDEAMIDAAQLLLQLSRSGTADMAQLAAAEAERSVRSQTHRLPVAFPTSSLRDDSSEQPRYESWSPGDARRHIVDSSLSPRARRMRAILTGLSLLPDEREKIISQKMTPPTLPIKHTDEAYWSNATLKAINDSPPKRRRTKKPDIDSEGDDTTEVEDEIESDSDDSDTGDPDYQAPPSVKQNSSPIKQASFYRRSGWSKLSAPPLTAQERRMRKQQMVASTSSSDNSESDSETGSDKERSDTPPRPSTSPISQTPSRAVSRAPIPENRNVSPECIDPAPGNLPTPTSSSSLERWQQAARRSQSHRRTVSLESFLEQSKLRFLEMKKEENDDSDIEMQFSSTGLITPSPDAEAATPRANILRITEMVTPASSGIEEGEIVDDLASDTTTIVSPTRQQEIRGRYQRPMELDYC